MSDIGGVDLNAMDWSLHFLKRTTIDLTLSHCTTNGEAVPSAAEDKLVVIHQHGSIRLRWS